MKSRLWPLVVFSLTLPGLGFAQEKVPAEAEVTAAKKPVQLTLRIYKTKLHMEGRLDDPSLWYQLEIKNIGKKKIPIVDSVFTRNPSFVQVNTSARGLFGVYLEIIGPDRKIHQTTSWNKDYLAWSCASKEERDDLARRAERKRARYEAAIKEGLSEKEAIKRMVTRDADAPLPDSPDITAPVWLEPQASIKTEPWAFQSKCDYADGLPPPKPIGHFAELMPDGSLLQGKYRIRAVYNHHLTKDDITGLHLTRKEENVRVATSFIPIEVSLSKKYRIRILKGLYETSKKAAEAGYKEEAKFAAEILKKIKKVESEK